MVDLAAGAVFGGVHSEQETRPRLGAKIGPTLPDARSARLSESLGRAPVSARRETLHADRLLAVTRRCELLRLRTYMKPGGLPTHRHLQRTREHGLEAPAGRGSPSVSASTWQLAACATCLETSGQAAANCSASRPAAAMIVFIAMWARLARAIPGAMTHSVSVI